MVAINGIVLSLSSERLYSERERRFQADADREERRSLIVSRARIALFLVGAGALIALFSGGAEVRAVLGSVAALAAAGFILLVGAHDRIEDRRDRLQALAAVNRHQRARVLRDWDAIPSVEAPEPSPSHPFAQDLDILGHASVFQLVGAVETPAGVLRLREWLLAPAGLDEIAERQAAVTELAPRLDFRQELLARAMLASRRRHAVHAADLQRFCEWAEGAPWLSSRAWLVWLTRVLGASATGLAIAQAAGLVREPLWTLPVLANIAVWFAASRKIEHTFTRAFARDSAPGQESRMFAVADAASFTSPLLAGLSARLAGSSRAMLRLQRLMELADIRLTALFHFPLNALTLWDFHVVWAVERWQMSAGRHVRDWFNAFGELEAVGGLAALRHDNASWALPEFGDEPVLDARGLGHPLIAEGVRVANDVRVGPPGTFLFVTGSNMSGKSTLLRAIGVNAVLAQAGAPVCAAQMRLPRVAVCTSMRVQDSLEQGVSYFMAALTRLRMILSCAAEHRPGERLLYLLDEILQGTNTAERQAAVRTILSQLLRSGAIGAVTSHDLNLADESPLREAANPVHFTEHFHEGPDGTSMSFDYLLRPGIATSRNALKLMKMIGIQESS